MLVKPVQVHLRRSRAVRLVRVNFHGYSPLKIQFLAAYENSLMKLHQAVLCDYYFIS